MCDLMERVMEVDSPNELVDRWKSYVGPVDVVCMVGTGTLLSSL